VGSANGFAYMPTVVRAALTEEGEAPENDAASHSDSWDGFDIPPDEDCEDPADFADLASDENIGLPVSERALSMREPVPDDVALHTVMRSLAPVPMPSMPVPSAVLSSFPPAERNVTRASSFMKEHPLWSLAQMSIALNKRDDALGALEQLYVQDPSHELGRMELFRLSAELENVALVAQHASWAVMQYAQAGRHEEACLIYRGVRSTFMDVSFSEDALAEVLRAADASEDGALVLDATNLLLRLSPRGQHTPRALLTTAKHQLLAGADDAAVNTLRYLVGSHPADPAAEPARRKLAELGF
jgi:hypothetical protein